MLQQLRSATSNLLMLSNSCIRDSLIYCSTAQLQIARIPSLQQSVLLAEASEGLCLYSVAVKQQVGRCGTGGRGSGVALHSLRTNLDSS